MPERTQADNDDQFKNWHDLIPTEKRVERLRAVLKDAVHDIRRLRHEVRLLRTHKHDERDVLVPMHMANDCGEPSGSPARPLM